MIGFLIIITLLLGGLVLLLTSSNTKEIAENWPKYRCSPTVMPFASLYGHDTAENFQFCLKNSFGDMAASAMGPFGQVLATFAGTLTVLIQNANSMRLQLATLVGGLTKITQEFQDRIIQVMFRVKITSSRIKMLMGRLFATFYAVIYMGMSGITAATNFGDTFLFKFLDTFCFDPDTCVEIEGKGEIPISKVEIGDVFRKTGGRVTSTLQFYADGQPMVHLPEDILVSTNHYVYDSFQKKYVKAMNHTDAYLTADWSGGNTRPLYCLNTSDHKIPVGEYLFLDYDETEEGDKETMKWIERSLNGTSLSVSESLSDLEAVQKEVQTKEYSPTISPNSKVVLKSNEIRLAKDLELGDQLSMGRVVGIITKEVTRVCHIGNDSVGEATLVWDEGDNKWVRANTKYSTHEYSQPIQFKSFVITPLASIELESGLTVRDYVEVHSPDAEAAYSKKIAK